MTRALERGEIASESFQHLSHLHVAWVYLDESSSVDEAAAKMRSTLQKFAAAAGHAEKYHETITQFWIRVIGHLRDSEKGSDMSEVLKAHPWLLEKNASMEYYSRETLFSDRARSSWVDPDLKPLSS